MSFGVWREGEQALDLDSFARACGFDVSAVQLLVDEGLLQPVVDQPAWRFGGEALARARRIQPLQRAHRPHRMKLVRSAGYRVRWRTDPDPSESYFHCVDAPGCTHADSRNCRP